MSEEHIEVRTEDKHLFCIAKLVEGDILLFFKSAGRHLAIPYTDIPRLVALAKAELQKRKKE